MHDPDIAGHDEGVCWYVDEMRNLKDVAVDFGEDGDTLAAWQHREIAVRAERGNVSGRGGVIRRIGPIARFQRYQGHDAQSSGASARAETSSAHRPEG